MALGLGSDARHRLGVGRAGRPRDRLAARPGDGQLVREDERFRPWLLLDRLDDELRRFDCRELDPSTSSGQQRRSCAISSGRRRRALTRAVLDAASRRLGRPFGTCASSATPALPAARGAVPRRDRAHLLPRSRVRRAAPPAVRPRDHRARPRARSDLPGRGARSRRARPRCSRRDGDGDAAEADLIRRLVARVSAADPGRDREPQPARLRSAVPRSRRARRSACRWRSAASGRRACGSAPRGAASPSDARRRAAACASSRPGRELIDTLDAVLRHDFSTRELPGHGLKAVARHLGIAGPDRELHPRRPDLRRSTARDPERVRRYATADVEEVGGRWRGMLGGAAFALARMAPRRYERLADAGAATGVIDPLLVRAYLRAGAALPAHEAGDGTPHSGAALHLFATGVAHRVVKADVASLYPSLMRAYRIGPARDRLGALLALVDRLVEQRLAAKARGARRAAGLGGAAHARGDVGGDEARRQLGLRLSRRRRRAHALRRRPRRERGDAPRPRDARPDVPRARRARRDAARGRHRRRLLRRARRLDARPTSGASSRRSPRCCRRCVQLEFDGRYAAMLSHEPKNYALLGYDGSLVLRGVAFRSSRAEPFGEAFLRRALARLLRRRRRRRARRVPRRRSTRCAAATLPTHRRLVARAADEDARASTSRRARARRELPYEAMLASGRTTWSVGERVRVYRTQGGEGGVVADADDEATRRRRRSARLRRRPLRARAARHVRRAARARVHARRLRGGVRRSRAAVAVRAADRGDADGAEHPRGVEPTAETIADLFNRRGRRGRREHQQQLVDLLLVFSASSAPSAVENDEQ